MPNKIILTILLSVNYLFANYVSDNSQWRALLHIQENNETSIQDTSFFSSGKRFSIQNEYNTIKQLLLLDQKQNTVCKYPARSYFIAKKENIEINLKNCKDLQGYLYESSSSSLSYVYVSSYLGAPISFFGHSFLKFNKKNNPFFSHTIGFTAEVPEGKGIFYLIDATIKNKTKGKFIYVPYYQMVEGYGAVEQRSMIEYKLDFTPEEIFQIRLHAYELINHQLPYSLLKKNCGYELLELLKVARPNFTLKKYFSFYILPSQIGEYARKEHIVKDAFYVPSETEAMYDIYETLSIESQEKFDQLVNNDNKISYLNNLEISKADRNKMAQILNMYYYILFRKYGNIKNDYYDVQKIRYKNDLNVEKVNTQKKYLSKISIGSYYNKGNLGTQVLIKPLLFNRLEDRGSELGEETLEMFSVSLNYINHELDVREINLIKLESYLKKHSFFNPFSWKMRIGFEQLNSDSLDLIIEAGAGWSFGTKNTLFYTILLPTIYSLEPNVGVSMEGGISIWMNQVHIGADYKTGIIYTSEKPPVDIKAYINQSLSDRSIISVSYEYRHAEYHLDFTYRF
jgi:hypothetical protein